MKKSFKKTKEKPLARTRKSSSQTSRTFSFRQQCKLTGMLLVFFFIGYKFTQLLSFHIFNPLNLALPGEDLIPFIPETFFIYTAVYLVFPAALLLMKKQGDFKKLALTFIITALIHFAFFIFMPVSYTMRPNLTNTNSILAQLIQLFYILDSTTNCFPSMHVSFAFLSYYAMKKFRPEHAPLFLLLAVSISVSTLLIKQHYVMDVLSAYVLVLIIKSLLEEKKYKAITKYIPQYKSMDNVWVLS